MADETLTAGGNDPACGVREMTNYPPVLSFGGGVNSSALAILLVNEGWRGHIVMSDTGCEWPDTYCWMDYFEREWLKPHGLGITRLGAEWRARRFALPLLDCCEASGSLPLAHPRWCTVHYKIEPIHKWMAQNGLELDTEMVGIALDENWRMPSKTRPLVDRGIDRNGCMALIRAAGLDAPRKSGCFICPFQRSSQWRELWERYPELYARAEALEIQMTVKRNRPSTLDVGGKYTLAMRRLAFESQMELFDDEEYTEYRPCQCHL